MAVEDVVDAARTGEDAPATSRGRSFSPRYPAWLTTPSFLYYAIFFLAPLGILVVFAVVTIANLNPSLLAPPGYPGLRPTVPPGQKSAPAHFLSDSTRTIHIWMPGRDARPTRDLFMNSSG